MMLDCKYCGGTGKLHDDADAYDEVGEWQARAEKAEHEIFLVRDAAFVDDCLRRKAEEKGDRLRELLREAIDWQYGETRWRERVAKELGEA